VGGFFDGAAECEGLQTVFDAGRDTPELIDRVAADVPQIHEAISLLRDSLPLVPHSGVGPMGRFFRLPNHYRSVSYLLPAATDDDPDAAAGAIVFKGTEPLLADFPAYFDWMMEAPFRASGLPLALHFPMDMKLPPAAMWIEECLAEQVVSSRLQNSYLQRHGRLARLPLPLFVFRMNPEQNLRYETFVRSRIPADAYWKIKNKVADGLGVEVYYYPELPVRVADLFVGNVRETFKPALTPELIEATFGKWTVLLAEMLCLDYMPFVPWHRGMGGCVDQGNVCIDGGFNDLLTLVPFDAIPDETAFRQSLSATIRMLAESMAAMASASLGLPSPKGSSGNDSDAVILAGTYVADQLREQVLSSERQGHAVDPRLKHFFDSPAPADILDMLQKAQRKRNRSSQFVGNSSMPIPFMQAETYGFAALA